MTSQLNCDLEETQAKQITYFDRIFQDSKSNIVVAQVVNLPVVATAHKLARIVYHLLKYQVPFVAQSLKQENAQYWERAIRNL